jgi:cell wall-associated NlpC family hydrolase
MDADRLSELDIAFARQVETWEGTKYVEQQSSRHGCDCVGLLVGAAAELGYDFTEFDNPNRKRNAVTEDLTARLSLCCTEINQIAPGRILTFKIGDFVQHCAVQCLDGQIIHAIRQRLLVCKTNPPQNLMNRLDKIYQPNWAKAKRI